MKLYNLRNIPAFINAIDECEGSIDCVDAFGTHFDLKDPRGILNVIHMIDHTGKIAELELHPDLSQDCSVILRYAADSGIAS